MGETILILSFYLRVFQDVRECQRHQGYLWLPVRNIVLSLNLSQQETFMLTFCPSAPFSPTSPSGPRGPYQQEDVILMLRALKHLLLFSTTVIIP